MQAYDGPDGQGSGNTCPNPEPMHRADRVLEHIERHYRTERDTDVIMKGLRLLLGCHPQHEGVAFALRQGRVDLALRQGRVIRPQAGQGEPPSGRAG